ncbi:putative endo-beta-1,4-glucanase D [Paramyrothecium foliicola]|nr:putative endo-beta-1,4-glucanase D [Paramyrothecium foliicola]
MKFAYAVTLLGSVAQAHYTIPRASANGVRTSDWQVIRRTTNWQNNGPVTDVSSSQMTCYELSPGSKTPGVLEVTAGRTITFEAAPNVYHPGPLLVYMAKAPSSAVDFDGKGAVWFKVYEDKPIVSSGGIKWPNDGKSSFDIPIPSCIANGQYLVRFEHIGLHSASAAGGAQLYISCAQVNVSGGSGSARPSLLSFPGSYRANDPGLQVNIYYPVPTNYKAPGGNPLQC